LYLDPLRERIKQNGRLVYRNGPEITLLIDLKTDWRTTYPVLRGVLKEYAEIFSTFRDGKKETNAVLAILSGDRSVEMFAGEAVRFAGYDGQLSDLDSTEPADLIPWISADWGGNFKWRGIAELPEDEKSKLEAWSAGHARDVVCDSWVRPTNPFSEGHEPMASIPSMPMFGRIATVPGR
jgi:glycerophosphoryl diester phosphodiesterase